MAFRYCPIANVQSSTFLSLQHWTRGNIVLRHDDAALAKASIGPMWLEILEYIEPVLESVPPSNNITKLSLFSAHDSTIAPLMASLGAKVWNNTNFPYYASMMVIEVSDKQQQQ